MSRTNVFETPAGAPTRVVLFGAGFIADLHLEILSALPDAEVVALCDRNRRRAEDLAEKYGVEQVVDSVEEAAELEAHVAHVLTPPDTHEALARELLEAGLGVFLEKPAVLSSEAARALARAAADRGLPLGVNHNHAYQPAFRRLQARLRAGEIGRLQHVQATWNVPLAQIEARDYGHWMLRAPRNIVFEQGVHPFSQIQALVGRVIEAETRILSSRELRPGQVFHDRWLVAAVGERGTAEVYLGFDQGFERNTLLVLGSDGCLEADYAHDTLAWETSTRWLDFWNSFLANWRRRRSYGSEALRGLGGYVGSTLGFVPREDAFFVGMRESIREFHRALRQGAEVPVDGERAAEVLEWCEEVVREVPAEEAPGVSLVEAGEARPGEVVVFGGTGFIGRHVVRRLLDADRPVTLLVRDPLRLPPEFEEPAASGRLRVFRGSIESGFAIGGALFGAERVIHLATGGGDTWRDVWRSMVLGTETIARACVRNEVQRLVFVSSIAALYTGDDADEVIDDSTRTDRSPELRSLYARGKIACESALLELHRDEGLPVVILRPGVVVGEGAPLQHAGLGYWPRDNQCIGWGRGEHPLPLVLVEDVADAIVAATLLESDELDGQALNLAARVPISAREMVAALQEATGRALQFTGRPIETAFAMELGKWVVKGVGKRPGNDFPSWRDLKARALRPAFTSRLAREVLGWRPVEEREAFLERSAQVHAPKRSRTDVQHGPAT